MKDDDDITINVRVNDRVSGYVRKVTISLLAAAFLGALLGSLLTGCVGGGGGDERNPPGYVCTVRGYRCVNGCVEFPSGFDVHVCSTSPEWAACDLEGLSDCRAECEQVAEECR